jgi:predicted enzyme related to lactoylglutathione lyase
MLGILLPEPGAHQASRHDRQAGALTERLQGEARGPPPAPGIVGWCGRIAAKDKNGETTMLKKVIYVALLVSDQNKALDFYTNVIGLEKRSDFPTPDGPRFLTVGVKGQDFDLVLWPGTPARIEAGSAVYTIEVEDCREAFETLKSGGVNFEPPEVLEFPWGYAARFQDPDGNRLQVREGRV